MPDSGRGLRTPTISPLNAPCCREKGPSREPHLTPRSHSVERHLWIPLNSFILWRAAPENDHAYPMEGYCRSQGSGVSLKPKIVKESLKLNWILRGVGLVEVQANAPSIGSLQKWHKRHFTKVENIISFWLSIYFRSRATHLSNSDSILVSVTFLDSNTCGNSVPDKTKCSFRNRRKLSPPLWNSVRRSPSFGC